MESIALFGGGSLSKLQFNEPNSSAIPMMVASTSRLCLNFRKPFFPQLISHGFTWNPNVRDNFLPRCCANQHSGNTHSNDQIQDALKSLLSLTQPDEKNSSISATKNEALKMAVEGKYDEALCHMKHLFYGDAAVAYEARLAHLQILIHLDEYNEALEFLEKIGNFRQSKAFDARLSLYEAVVHTMLGNDNKAKALWKTYLDIDNGNGNGNGNSNNFVMSAKSILKPLLSLKPPQLKTDLNFNIIPAKEMALKAVLNGDYGAAERHMKDLCNLEDGRNSIEVALEARFAYTQILIYLDKYDKALERLNETENQFPPPGSDPRPSLYKAIGLTALGKHEDAKFLWKAFMETIGVGLPNPNED